MIFLAAILIVIGIIALIALRDTYGQNFDRE